MHLTITMLDGEVWYGPSGMHGKCMTHDKNSEYHVNIETTSTGIDVTFNGTQWIAGTDYTYNNTDGLFTTIAPVTVPAATYSQDPVTGTWIVQPGESVLVITLTGVQIRT